MAWTLRKYLADWRSIVLGRYAKTSYSQEGEDMVLYRLFGEQARGFYVEVGAHHPIRFSNTYFFYRRGWRGINIEPNPEAAARFHQLRRRDLTLTIGVAEAPGRLTYYCFDDAALNTFDAALAERREREHRRRIERTIEVSVERLDVLLARYLPPNTPIDFLSVDVEGLDLPALRSSDWSRFRPRCVLAEALDSTLDEFMDAPIVRFMKRQDYGLLAKTFNTLFFHDARRPVR